MWLVAAARMRMEFTLAAGHILGAAQLLIEWRGERVVYTGDIKLRPPLCGVEARPVPCDRLITECTFGLPVYHFLTREEARRGILSFARECLEDGIVPAFLAYPLGRGQEIVHVLCQAGIRTGVHGAIARYVPVYEAAGFACPGWELYDARNTAGKALVVAPGFSATLEARGPRYRVAYVSGWAALAVRGNHDRHLLVVGHWRPAVTIHDDAGAERKLPAFLSAPRITVLPAFSPFAGGVAYGRDLPPEIGPFVAGQRVEVVAVTGRSAVHVRTITYER